MSSQDINGLPHSFGDVFPLPPEDDLPRLDQCQNVSSCSGNGRNSYHASPTLPPPPTVTLPTSGFPRVERSETTQFLLAYKHQNGNFVSMHALEMTLYIDKLETLSVIFSRKQAIDLVLLLFLESYSLFIENFYMSAFDVILIDLTHILIVAEAKSLKSTSEVKVFKGSNSKISMDVDNGGNGGPEKIYLPNGNGSTNN
ncbi:hypothetical protein Lser_V15G33705 [Lactuca serriola]